MNIHTHIYVFVRVHMYAYIYMIWRLVSTFKEEKQEIKILKN